jgi:Domain of unknown function (DUF6285)
LIPGKVTLPDHDDKPVNMDMPRNDELLVSVRDFLRGDVMAQTTGRTQFLARVAANSLDILLRDDAKGTAFRAGEQRRLEALLHQTGDYFSLRQALCHQLRQGTIDLESAALQDYLRFATLTQALIDQPNYSGVTTALGQA